ncbi:hypothetical protein ACNVED_04040 [Legionella sp. D16C41]|uniref:hypothetical protein n=1 Tax=Legionella sp. D16C41 TaxID=3402688 RepID=UPI003AF910AA
MYNRLENDKSLLDSQRHYNKAALCFIMAEPVPKAAYSTFFTEFTKKLLTI